MAGHKKYILIKIFTNYKFKKKTMETCDIVKYAFSLHKLFHFIFEVQ